jgi:hypothetical protein
MHIRSKKGRRATGALVFVALVMTATYALTAANTVDASKAGDGEAAITGYAVTNIHYNLNAANPANIDSVDFDLDSVPVAGSTIRAQLVSAGTWFSCTNAGVDVNCLTPGQTVLAADNLRVVVAQ